MVLIEGLGCCSALRACQMTAPLRHRRQNRHRAELQRWLAGHLAPTATGPEPALVQA